MLVVVSLDVERFKKRFQGDDGSVLWNTHVI